MTTISMQMKGDAPGRENKGFCFVEFDSNETARDICKKLQVEHSLFSSNTEANLCVDVGFI